MYKYYKKSCIYMSIIKQFFLDMRDFSYMYYVKRYGKVSAKNWPGYKGMFLVIYLPYYIVIILSLKRIIPENILLSIPKEKPNILILLIYMIVFLSPYVFIFNLFLTKLEKTNPILVKSINANWKRKQAIGFLFAIGGIIVLFGYFKISEFYK